MTDYILFNIPTSYNIWQSIQPNSVEDLYKVQLRDNIVILRDDIPKPTEFTYVLWQSDEAVRSEMLGYFNDLRLDEQEQKHLETVKRQLEYTTSDNVSQDMELQISEHCEKAISFFTSKDTFRSISYVIKYEDALRFKASTVDSDINKYKIPLQEEASVRGLSVNAWADKVINIGAIAKEANNYNESRIYKVLKYTKETLATTSGSQVHRYELCYNKLKEVKEEIDTKFIDFIARKKAL